MSFQKFRVSSIKKGLRGVVHQYPRARQETRRIAPSQIGCCFAIELLAHSNCASFRPNKQRAAKMMARHLFTAKNRMIVLTSSKVLSRNDVRQWVNVRLGWLNWSSATGNVMVKLDS